MEKYIAIDNVCAWPNLTLLPDDSIIATIFNQPCHGKWEGDVECWVSEDGGISWQYKSTPAKHDPDTNRMNVAAGLTHNDDLLVWASGWSNLYEDNQQAEPFRKEVLHPWSCRSNDEGKSWKVDKKIISSPPLTDAPHIIPFGDVVCGPDNWLGVSCYGRINKDRSKRKRSNTCAWFIRSEDDGYSWQEPVKIGDDLTESTPLHLGDGKWLIAARTGEDRHLRLFRSQDNGLNWKFEQSVSLPYQHPAHLLKLIDGRILLTYGSRVPNGHGIHVRFSEDDGHTWSAPQVLVSYPQADHGYPSSIQINDGTVITAYYAAKQPDHHRYHMAVIRWQP